MRTTRISSSDTSGIISFGDSTLYLEPAFHKLFTSATSTAGITIGNPKLPAPTGNPFVDIVNGFTQFAAQSAVMTITPAGNNTNLRKHLHLFVSFVKICIRR